MLNFVALAALAAAPAAPAVHGAGCARFVVPPSPEQGMADAALVRTASHHDASPRSLGLALAGRGWRVVWAEPDGSEPGIFFFRGPAGAERFVDVWGGPTSDRAGALRWARSIGTPPALAGCFADRLVRNGP